MTRECDRNKFQVRSSLTSEAPSDPKLDAEVKRIVKMYKLGQMLSSKWLSSGVMTYKYLVRCVEGTQWILRFYPQGRGHVVNFEPDLMRRCKAAGMAVPEVIGDSRSDPDATLQYVIYRMIPGNSLGTHAGSLSIAALNELALKVVNSLHRMATIPVEGWGVPSNSQQGQSNSWEEFITQTFDYGLFSIERNHLLTPKYIDYLHQLRDSIEKFRPPAQAGFAWGDLSPDNIIVEDDGRFAGIVDFEGALIVEPLLSLGYLRARSVHSQLYQAMVTAWPTNLGPDEHARIDLYAITRAMRVMEFAAQSLPTGQRRIPVEVFLSGALDALKNLATNYCGRV